MNHARASLFALTAILVSSLSFAVIVGGRRPVPAFASEIGTTAGQLTILNRKGEAAALCPLKRTNVVADVSGYCARVRVEQQFANPSKEVVEAVYTFPLPADAAVDDMTMTIGRRVVKGEIKKREEARVIYETAKAAGQAAALLDQERPNIFTQSVANIMPGERISITISYVQNLKYQDGQYEFSYPMVVGPRFVAGGGQPGPGVRGPNVAAPAAGQQVPESAPGNTQSVVTDASKITPPITPKGTRAGHDITVTVNLDAGIPLTDVKSQLHQIRVNRVGESRAVVKLENQNEIPNKDFILRYKASGSDVQEGVLAYANANSKHGYFTLILQPPAAPEQNRVSPKEMVFVIDQTGSQAGAPIAKAKETMRYCIQNLNPGDTFQLIGFNTQVFPCFPAPVEANPATIAQALKFLEPIEGSGGTDILKSVDYALQIPDDPDRLRIICYMTDGYVGNDMQIIDHVKKNRGRTRMFPCGIGNSVNRFLIEGMAKEGRGVADIIDLNASGEAVASKFYKRIAQPLLLDIHVDWGDLPVDEVYPKQIPDLFSSGPIILKGRYNQPGEGDVTIRGTLRGKPWSRTVHVVLPAEKNDGAAIATVWAREKIEDLQSEDWLGAQSGNPKPEIKEQIVNTALEYRLMSQYTSFVAVEQKVVNIGGKQRTVDVPVDMPDGVSYEGGYVDSDGRSMMLGRSKARVVTRYNAPVASPGVNYLSAAQPARAGAVALGIVPATKVLSQSGAGFGLHKLAESDKTPKDRPVELYYKNEAEFKQVKETLRASKPDERKALERQLAENLRASKLHTKIVALLKQTGPKVIDVQLWISDMPATGLAQLKKLGVNVTATLAPGKLLLGTVELKKLEKLIELPWVVFVEPPKYK